MNLKKRLGILGAAVIIITVYILIFSFLGLMIGTIAIFSALGIGLLACVISSNSKENREEWAKVKEMRRKEKERAKERAKVEDK